MAERDISFNLTLYPFSRKDLTTMWGKIDYLTSLCYPHYKKDSTMTYYDESGKNILVTYEMLDENGKPSIESVYDRRIKDAIPMIMSLSDQQDIISNLQTPGSS